MVFVVRGSWYFFLRMITCSTTGCYPVALDSRWGLQNRKGEQMMERIIGEILQKKFEGVEGVRGFIYWGWKYMSGALGRFVFAAMFNIKAWVLDVALVQLAARAMRTLDAGNIASATKAGICILWCNRGGIHCEQLGPYNVRHGKDR